MKFKAFIWMRTKISEIDFTLHFFLFINFENFGFFLEISEIQKFWRLFDFGFFGVLEIF